MRQRYTKRPITSYNKSNVLINNNRYQYYSNYKPAKDRYIVQQYRSNQRNILKDMHVYYKYEFKPKDEQVDNFIEMLNEVQGKSAQLNNDKTRQIFKDRFPTIQQQNQNQIQQQQQQLLTKLFYLRSKYNRLMNQKSTSLQQLQQQQYSLQNK